MAAPIGPGITRLASRYDVTETLARLERLLRERGLTVFARIDFSGDAVRAGLSLRPEQLLIFGNPRAGTALMQAMPASGIDLPLKALIWEDDDAKVWLAYNTPQYLIERHGLAASSMSVLAAPIALFEAAVR